MPDSDLTKDAADTAGAVGAASGSKVTAAPYMSGKQFIENFEKYEVLGLPDVFDISYFAGKSGSHIAQIRGSMRHLELIDDNYVPTPLFHRLVNAGPEERKLLLEELFREKYADALKLPANATSGQLDKVFQERGLRGATVDRAVAFFLHVADYLEIQTSPLFKQRKPRSSSPRKPKRPTSKQVETAPAVEQSPTTKTVSAEEQKAQYVAMLMELAKAGNDTADRGALLDRIEAVLGIDSPKTKVSGGGSQDA